jgi:electron-transferring-flavoprotein dehydrogenase
MLSRVAQARHQGRISPFSSRLLHRSAARRNDAFDLSAVERASDEVDVCIVGAGPAGLSAAIRLKQLEQEKGKEIRVVVLEKGSEVGAYWLSSPGTGQDLEEPSLPLSRRLLCTWIPV